MGFGTSSNDLEDMFISRRGNGHSQLTGACLITVGALFFGTGSLIGSPSAAAPSPFLELNGNARPNGALDRARSGVSSRTNGAFAGGAFVEATTPPTQPTAIAATASNSTTTSSSTTSTSTTSTSLAPTTTTSTTLAPTTTTTVAIGISAITIERPTTTTIAPQVLGVLLTNPEVAATVLPRTGAIIQPLLIWAGLALMVGGALVFGARPRRPREL